MACRSSQDVLFNSCLVIIARTGLDGVLEGKLMAICILSVLSSRSVPSCKVSLNLQGHAMHGQLEIGHRNLRWAADYLLKCHTAPNEFVGQVATQSHKYQSETEIAPA